MTDIKDDSQVWCISSFDKNIGSGTASKKRSNLNKVLAQELQNQVVKKLKRRKVYARFKDNIGAADLAEMGSLSSKNGGVKYLLHLIDLFTKYA